MKKKKMKINKSVARRFKLTARGKILRRSSFARHLRSKKNKRQIRSLKATKEVKGVLKKKIAKMLGAKKR